MLSHVEIAVQQSIDMIEHIENELSGNAAAVVVGFFQDFHVLDSVGAEQEEIVGSHRRPKGRERNAESRV